LEYSPAKLLNQIKPNLAEIIPEIGSFRIVPLWGSASKMLDWEGN
jgi:hypothetical protein